MVVVAGIVGVGKKLVVVLNKAMEMVVDEVKDEPYRGWEVRAVEVDGDGVDAVVVVKVQVEIAVLLEYLFVFYEVQIRPPSPPCVQMESYNIVEANSPIPEGQIQEQSVREFD
jgi:hypothetical protein